MVHQHAAVIGLRAGMVSTNCQFIGLRARRREHLSINMSAIGLRARKEEHQKKNYIRSKLASSICELLLTVSL